MKKNLKFNWTTNRFEMENGNPKTYDDINAVNAWVEQDVRTSSGALLFPESYGTITNQLVGKRGLNNYYQGELERTLQSSVKLNPYIDSVKNIHLNEDNQIEFEVKLK